MSLSMENMQIENNDEKFMAQLQECAVQLAENLQTDDLDAASKLINKLIDARNDHIFNKVGKLTRALHDAIVNFNVEGDLAKTPPHVKGSEIRDASDRLYYVIELTQQAADRTMDKVEEAAPVALALGQESEKIREEWQRLKRREISKEEFKELYTRIDGFLEKMSTGAGLLSNNLQDIILEQGYQDLTGQVLKRVIGLVCDVERDLVNLMRMACQVEEVTGLVREDSIEDRAQEQKPKKDIVGEGPQIHASTRADVVSGQDDVDDLLSSLGF